MTRSTPSAFKSGFVALIGRPNAGKSTLVNALVGRKVAIATDTPQTTRNPIRAIVERPEGQIVFVDTPGLHRPRDPLGSELNRAALGTLGDVDVIAFLVDATAPVGSGDEWVALNLEGRKTPLFLVITKADLADPDRVSAQVEAASNLLDFDAVIVTSATAGFNIEGLVTAVFEVLPEGPRWFPEGTDTDQPIESMIGDFIREKVILETSEEIPHAVGVAVEDLVWDERRDHWSIVATIFVERDSQKGIIVGKGGSRIKQIGSSAREDLIRLLGGTVYLDLRVKVKKGWRRDIGQIRRFGYGDRG